MILIFLSILVVTCVTAEDPIGIINGELTTWEKHKFMGSLITKDNHYVCPVTRVRNSFMTAAMCVVDRDLKNFRIRYGSSFYNREGNVYRIKTVMIHPDFTRKEIHDNIALVTVRETIKELTEDVKMSVPERSFFPFPDLDSKLVPEWGPVFIDESEIEKSDSPRVTIHSIYGWGISSFHPVVLSEQLRRAYYNVLSKPTLCEKEYNMTMDTIKMFCAIPENATQSACLGDIGAPLVLASDFHLGILTRSTCDGSKPSIFLRLSHYFKWIYDYRE